MTTARSLIRHPHAATQSLDARAVARAYNYPTDRYTGAGYTCGIVELGGGFGPADLRAYFGTSVPSVTAVPVAGGQNKSDGADGADGEVLLDIEVAAAVAPGARFRVYFAPNTDAGFLAAIEQAAAECDVVSISWGGPETSWDAATMDRFDAALAAARKAGVTVFVAAGDSGSDDGTNAPTVDFPASSPNVVSCGGTRLTVNADGARAAEVTWDDDDTNSATGGGVSRHFPGRQVPDVAGNADPSTGYRVIVDGSSYVIGGTSAVAPLYAGLALLLCEALGHRVGTVGDFQSTVTSNPTICYDVTVGDNGAYRAGPGRDQTTGFGVVDGARMLAALTTTPAPGPAPTPTPSPPTAPTGSAVTRTFPNGTAALEAWAAHPHFWHLASEGAKEWAESAVVASTPAKLAARTQHGHDYRDAGTGRFVTEDYADHNQSTTVREERP